MKPEKLKTKLQRTGKLTRSDQSKFPFLGKSVIFQTGVTEAEGIGIRLEAEAVEDLVVWRPS